MLDKARLKVSCADYFNVLRCTIINVDTFLTKIQLILHQIVKISPPTVDISPLRPRLIFWNDTTAIVKLDLIHTHPIALTAQPNYFVDLLS